MNLATTPTSEEVKNDLNAIAHHLFNTSTPLLPEQKPSTEQAFLKRLDEQLKTYRTSYLQRSRELYQALENSDLQSDEGKQLIATLKVRLATQLINMDQRDRIDDKPAKTFLKYDAGFTAIGHEARQAVTDRLLHPQAGELLQKLDAVPMLRPAMYALQFSYQDTTVELAGAFVVTEKDTRRVKDLQTDQSMGFALLFTPTRGIEFFNSLADLDSQLRTSLNHPSGSEEFMSMLPTRYHAVGAAGIWPLLLAPIDSRPLFEHTYDALIEKRTQDIERALSFADNPQQDLKRLLTALDRAIAAALPDLTPRLALRAQTLFERHLRYSAPDWFRSASTAQKDALAQHLHNYQQARQELLDLMEPAGSLTALARQQWLERLSEDLEIDDLEPAKLSIATDRRVPGYGVYVHQSSLLELSLRGPHTGDELPGSEFLKYTTLTYDDAPLPPDYADVTPAWLIRQAVELQPRIDFNHLQNELQARPAIKPAIEQMLDKRIVALAHTAVLQGHLLDSDLQLIERLRDGSDARLRAATLSLHGAQLQDLWVLRQNDDGGALKRLLLCTPQAPRAQQFQAFDSERECQTHLLGWAKHSDAADSMAGYLISRAPMRFRAKLRHVLAGLSFKPEALEHQKVTFAHTGSHPDCLRAMAEHVLATRIDDYDFCTPLWYRSTTAANRRKLTTLSEDAEGALRAFNKHALSGSRFPAFDDYVHEQAKISLNRLLKRTTNDVDPDTVWAYSPSSVVRSWTPKPLNYTTLYRDGYADGVGFLDEKFSRSARFRGPQGIDLSNLTAQNVARSVTGVWIGQRYIDKVKAELQGSTSEGYDFRRNATLAITQRQMKSAALECQLQGHIASRDLQWLEQSIDSMAETSGSIRTKYPLHRLMIDGEWVLDAWLFSHGDNPALLYTPEAPDGVAFREALLFNYLLQQQSGMLEYLTLRVGVSARTRVRTHLENIKKGLPKDLNKTTPSPARYDSTRAVAAVSDLRTVLYDMRLQRRIDDVNATTTSRAEMIAGLVWTSVEWIAAIATAPFPLLSLSTGLLLAFKDAMLALHAYRQGDHGEAFQHLLGYLFNSAGAVLTDLRPTLRSLKLARRPLRQSIASARNEQQNAMAVIDQVSSGPERDEMSAVIFRGQVYYIRENADSIGRHVLYLNNPEFGDPLSSGILAVRNADGVMVRAGVPGGAPKYEAVPEPDGPHKIYGVEPKYRQRIEAVMNPQTRETILISSQDYMGTDPHLILVGVVENLASTRTAYLKQVEKLSTDAAAHFADLAALPARAEVPPIADDLSFKQLIASDAVKGKNLVIGAQPGSIASKQLLINHLDTLVESGFKRLYVEYLAADVFNAKLEKMNKGKSWRHIKKHLEAVDRALGHEKDAPFSYLALVRTAREKGLKIHALDASTSYKLEGALVLDDVSPLTPRSNSLRNFYSHKTLAADISDASEERWVILTEQSRMCTFDNTPGLADLHAAVAVRVEDVAQDQAARISLDSAGAIAGDSAAKGDYRVQWPTAYKAPQPVSRPAAIAPVVEHFSEYDIPPSMRDDIAQMLHQPYAMDSRYTPTVPKEQQAHDAFIANRKRLEKKARDAFTQYTPPEAATLPTLTSDTTFEAFLQRLADGRLNLLIGEAHSHVSSKALLKKYMKALKQAGYDTLYVEHLFTDLHQADLDTFFRTQRMPDRLKNYLLVQDRGQMPTYNGNDTYTEVLQAAAKYKVRIRALDCTASYHLKGVFNEDISRNEMFSYFATQVIEADQLAHGPHKWVAFIGNAHTNYNLGVPGLADTLSAVSLHVRDSAPELARDIHRGTWRAVASERGTNSRALRSDFLLEVAVAGKKKPALTSAVERSKLTRSGMFMIENTDTGELRLVHQSRSGDIVETPIQVDDHGLFFIDRWEKKEERFKYLGTLIDMLVSDLKLTEVK
ncbi:membrane-targeted effector domain-containing toxin [Pseudomonas sp. P155]|uniref:Membrane-targeted effector domain-containing toxin n=1 Tax=Pseudomonas neuropathica TaxID=2730425 RepID=A0ABS0BF54_9PSED|nr:membrane-targeted effector domain-containing toxin [Pseudomonas neuropathica]MBF6032439.1 membrane-targeted effector domain-containing toxin [Pseudomonas neuropathica]